MIYRHERNGSAILMVLACAALALTGCEDDATTTPSDPPPEGSPPPPTSSTGQLRVAQLTEDGRTIDVVVDGTIVARNVTYTGVTGYVELSEGEHRVQAFRAGTTGVAMVETTLFLQGGDSRTAAVVGNDPVDLVVVNDDLDTSTDNARVRLFNAVPDFPANLDLGVVNGPLVVAGVAFSEASEYETVVPGNYAFVLKRGGTEEELATVLDVFPAATTATIFAIGTLARGDIDLIVARDAS